MMMHQNNHQQANMQQGNPILKMRNMRHRGGPNNMNNQQNRHPQHNAIIKPQKMRNSTGNIFKNMNGHPPPQPQQQQQMWNQSPSPKPFSNHHMNQHKQANPLHHNPIGMNR